VNGVAQAPRVLSVTALSFIFSILFVGLGWTMRELYHLQSIVVEDRVRLEMLERGC